METWNSRQSLSFFTLYHKNYDKLAWIELQLAYVQIGKQTVCRKAVLRVHHTRVWQRVTLYSSGIETLKIPQMNIPEVEKSPAQHRRNLKSNYATSGHSSPCSLLFLCLKGPLWQPQSRMNSAWDSFESGAEELLYLDMTTTPCVS